ncbi:MAG: Rpn family recombination-promoting nuclease/putative transposase [Aulosira sp. DedQUE10]|nr:Rpn family recombination-promoting nuclease/putative transposase [Aulosira sp. DedQUE10]
MPKAADIGSKRLISLAPNLWIKWVTQIPNAEAADIITSEFQWVSRQSDVLIRAYSPQDGEFLVLNEFQLRYTSRLPRRMLAYAALATEKYELPVYPVLINILQPSPDVEIATSYQSLFRGLYTRQDYHVINLWEVEAKLVFEQSITSLIPFVPVLKGGGEESIVREALQVLRRQEQLDELEPLLAFFANFVLDSRLVQEIMRWDMAVLEQSPWYQEIFRAGEQKGIQQEILSGIALGLELKFGTEGLQLLPEIQEIKNVELLKAIRDAIKTVDTWEEIRQIYRTN